MLGEFGAHAHVAAAGARGDEIGHASRLLEESRGVDIAREKLSAKLNHFEQTPAHHGRLGVVAPAHAGDKPGRNGNNVFQRASKAHAGDVLHHADVEIGAVEKVVEHLLVHVLALDVVGGQAVGNGRLGVLLLGNLERQVGARQRATVNAKRVGNVLRQRHTRVGRDVEALETRNGADVFWHVTGELAANVAQKLVRDVEH